MRLVLARLDVAAGKGELSRVGRERIGRQLVDPGLARTNRDGGVPAGIERHGVRVTTSTDEAVAGADVIMMLRIQQERLQGAFFPSLREYFAVFGLTAERAKRSPHTARLD